MNKFIKASLIAAAFLFVAGCASQSAPSVHHSSVANAHSKVAKGMHPAQKCKGKKCVDKLGNTYTGDSSK